MNDNAKLSILGSSDLMIIEQLNLFYHLSCFVCARCGIQLSDGQNETSVRISNGLIYCYICYHRLRKPLSNKDKNKPRTPERNEQHSSLSRTAATAGPLMNTSSSYQTSKLAHSSCYFLFWGVSGLDWSACCNQFELIDVSWADPSDERELVRISLSHF